MTQALVVLACRVLETMLEPRVRALNIPATYISSGYHRTPKKMTPTLQARIDTLTEPSRIILGYGLCGNGIVGLKSRQHTLIVPRTDDCIAMLLGSRHRYEEEFNAHPGTYYLTRGWLESGSNPLAEYEILLTKYDQATADWVIDQQYRNYRRLVFIALDQDDLEANRERIQKIADFCVVRWKMQFESQIGTSEFIEHLLRAGIQERDSSNDFLVIPPGGEIRQDMFLNLR